MAVYFMYMKTFGRGNGSSATSAIAYRAGERIRDERTGKVFDHSDRQDVMHKEIVLPAKWDDADMSWARERANLWNAVEAAETRRNARVAREFLVALPAELSPAQRVELTRGFARELVDRHGFAVDFAIHSPRADPRNFHAHLLATTREINSSGFGAKTDLEVSDRERAGRGLEPFFKEVNFARERWAAVTNAALERANVPLRVDHRSLEAQGIGREPQPMLPRAVYEMERRGQYTQLGERIRQEYRERVAARTNLPAPVSLEEIRRQAREEWLRIRQGNAAASGASPATTRFFDDDLTR
jgi:ATP-dependent exoDNAse (exonuclease V) alpha subunit